MGFYDHVDKGLTAFVTRVPGYLVAGVVVVLYAAGLVIPLSLGSPTHELVLYNLTGTVLAWVVVFAWVLVQFEARERRHLVEWTSNLRLLTSAEFEWLVGELFRRQGWRVREVGGHGTPDGNVDLEMFWGRDRYLVQCKRWAARHIPVDEIRQFAGTVVRESLDPSAGYFVTLSDFSEAARAEAKKLGMRLIDRRALDQEMTKVRRTEPCPICEAPMRLDKSVHGWWFRCVASGCEGKRDLGQEPGRAIELLTNMP